MRMRWNRREVCPSYGTRYFASAGEVRLIIGREISNMRHLLNTKRFFLSEPLMTYSEWKIAIVRRQSPFVR